MVKQLGHIIGSYTAKKRLIIIIISIILLQLITNIFYWRSRSMLSTELERNAETELMFKSVLIKSMFNHTSNGITHHMWDVQRNIGQPDSMYNAVKRLVKNDNYIVGGEIAFKPYYYPSKGRLFEPYAKRVGDTVITMNVAGHDHDYTQSKFYLNGLGGEKFVWSDPYVDVGGTDEMVCTLSTPIYHNDSIVAVFGVDMSLFWLSDTLNARHRLPSSFNMLLTEGGEIIAMPDKNHPRYSDVEQIVRIVNDNSFVRDSSSTKVSVSVDFTSETDNWEGRIYYANMRGKPHWKIINVTYDNEVYGALNRLTLDIWGLMIVSLVIMTLMVRYFSQSESKLARLKADRESISSELRIASSIQQSMLPAVTQGSGFDMQALLLPAKEVGGDLYDFCLRNEKLFFCVGDVSGKGVPSALVMAVVHALFHASVPHESNPAYIMRSINKEMCANNESNMFITFFIGALDLPTGRLRYANAGHNPPVILGDTPRMLDVNPNMPLGVIADFNYEAQETLLAKGEGIFLYTDGLTEAFNKERSLFGENRMMSALKQCITQRASISETVNYVASCVLNFTQDCEQSDDLTMLAVQYSGIASDNDIQYTGKITLSNDVAQVTALNEWVNNVAQQLQLTESDSQKIKLAVEEAVVNVMNYAYPSGTQGNVAISASANSNTLTFTIEDNGAPFDPTVTDTADTSLSLDDRPIGGLGIFLVRQMMDSINYERVDGKNILTLRKTLSNE